MAQTQKQHDTEEQHIVDLAHTIERAPKWPVSLGILATGLLYFLLPEELSIGPNWLLLAIECAILTPLWLYWLSGRLFSHRMVRTISLSLLVLSTLALASAIFILVSDLSAFRNGLKLLTTGALLWSLNIVVFSLWYWNTDGGGPRARHQANYKAKDFVFPQQTMGEQWAPDFFDYVFLAFNTSTAFSPTDTYPLTQRAKLLAMIQSLLSLIIVAILISRVANIF